MSWKLCKHNIKDIWVCGQIPWQMYERENDKSTKCKNHLEICRTNIQNMSKILLENSGDERIWGNIIVTFPEFGEVHFRVVQVP